MLNGIDVAGLNGARDAIRQEPAAGIARYGVLLNWQDGTKIEAQATPMSVGQDRIERNFKWTIDEPPQLLGNSTGPTPQEYLMSGVAACIMVGFVVNAAVHDIKINRLAIRMEGSLDLAGFLNLRPDAQVKMGGLTYEIEVAADASKADLEKVAEKAFTFSPNAMTVANGTSVTGSLKIVPA
jgi:uncharacterized OsmC-like protein